MEKLCIHDRIKNSLRNNNGVVLVITLFIVILVTVWGVATLNITNNAKTVSYNSQRGLQAYYLAEAGLEEAIQRIKANPEEVISFTDTSLETGTVKVSQTGTVPGTIILEAIGRVGNFKKTLTVELEITGGGGDEGLSEPALMAIGGLLTTSFGGSFTINGDIFLANPTNIGPITINGNVVANSTLEMNNTKINGDIYTNDNVRIGSGGGNNFSGNIYTKGSLDIGGGGSQTFIQGNLYTQMGYSGNRSRIAGLIYSDIPPADSPYVDFAVPGIVDGDPPELPEGFFSRWDYLPEEGLELMLNSYGFIYLDELPSLPSGKTYYIVPDGSKLSGNNSDPGITIYSEGGVDVVVNWYDSARGGAVWPDFTGVTIVAEELRAASFNELDSCVLFGKDSLSFGESGSRITRNSLFISNEDISLKGTIVLNGGIITPKELDMRGSSRVTGSVIAGSIDGSGSAVVTFLKDNVVNLPVWPDLGLGGYEITFKRWN